MPQAMCIILLKPMGIRATSRRSILKAAICSDFEQWARTDRFHSLPNWLSIALHFPAN